MINDYYSTAEMRQTESGRRRKSITHFSSNPGMTKETERPFRNKEKKGYTVVKRKKEKESKQNASP